MALGGYLEYLLLLCPPHSASCYSQSFFTFDLSISVLSPSRELEPVFTSQRTTNNFYINDSKLVHSKSKWMWLWFIRYRIHTDGRSCQLFTSHMAAFPTGPLVLPLVPFSETPRPAHGRHSPTPRCVYIAMTDRNTQLSSSPISAVNGTVERWEWVIDLSSILSHPKTSRSPPCDIQTKSQGSNMDRYLTLL